jgi:hypothetical protein
MPQHAPTLNFSRLAHDVTYAAADQAYMQTLTNADEC